MGSDWTLGELGKVITGKTPPKSVDDAYSESGMPFITPKDMDGSKWVFSTERYLSKSGVASVQKSVVPEGSIAVSCIGSDLGKAVRIPLSSVTNQQINTLIPDPEKCDSDYLYYLLSTMQQRFKSIAGGSATPILNKGHFSAVQVQLPDLGQQRQKAHILSTIDDKIQVNKHTNQTLEQIAQAIFKSWFVDFEPVKAKINALAAGGSEEDALLAAMQAISGKDKAQLTQLQSENPERYNELRTTAELFPSAMQDSELGEIPEGWSCFALDEIAKYQNGLALQKFRPEGNEDWLPVVKIAQLKKGFADGQEKAKASIKPDCIIENGDVVFSWSGSLMIDTWCGGRAALNQHLFKITSQDYPKWLFFHFTRHHLEEFQRIAADKAVTMGHIKREHLKQALCAVPDTRLLDAVGITLGTILEKQITLRLESDSLKQLRDSLLPKLLSGDVSLDPDAQCDKSSPDHLEEPDLNTLISEIENDLPPKSHFVVHESSRNQSNKLGMIGFSTTITGSLAEGGAEYFKLPTFLRELRNNKALEKLFSATIDGFSGIPFLMDAATAIMNKFLGQKIKFDQRTALVLLAFPKELTRKTSELLANSHQLSISAGLPVINEDELSNVLKNLREHGLVTPIGKNSEEWRLVEKFNHEIDNWS